MDFDLRNFKDSLGNMSNHELAELQREYLQQLNNMTYNANLPDILEAIQAEIGRRTNYAN